MIGHLRLAMLASAILFVPVLATAESPERTAPVSTTAAASTTPAGLTPTERQERRLMQGEMDARTRQAQQAVAELQKRFDATADNAYREAVQRHIEATKLEGLLDLFRIQLRHAQAAGRAADAHELQAAIDARTKLAPVALRALPPIPVKAAPIAPAQLKKEGGK